MKAVKCLVMLPFDASAERLKNTVNRVLEDNKVWPVSMETAFAPGALWIDELSDLLRRCDFVIADVSRTNPNVLFELGVAHGLGKPIVLLLSAASEAASIPAALMGYQYLSYDPTNLTSLSARLNRVIGSVASRAEKA